MSGFPGSSSGKEPACQCRRYKNMGSIPGSGRCPGGGCAIHSSILAWRIPWTEKPGGLQSIWSHRVGHDWSDLACTHALVHARMNQYFLSQMTLKLEINYKIRNRWLSGKESTCQCQSSGLIPRSGRSLGGGNGSPLQYSCWNNPMDRETWQATVHGVAKSWTGLSNWACIHTNK